MNRHPAPPITPLLSVEDLHMAFPVRGGLLRRVAATVHAVNGVSLTISEGETLGLAGESGCGKTTLGRCILRVHPPTSGKIRFRGCDGKEVDLAGLSTNELKPYRRELRMIFQDPHASLNPRLTVRQILTEPLAAYRTTESRELPQRIAGLLEMVGIPPDSMDRYPHSFSTGQRQRIGIARALSLEPRLVVADEPVSALDVSVQAQILNLLQNLQDRYRLAYLFISHDLSVLSCMADRVAIMYLGRLVEVAPTGQLFANPRHPYSAALLSAIPSPEPHRRVRRASLTGEVPDLIDPPGGCPFHPRCPYVRSRCKESAPRLAELAPGHWVACHIAESLDLPGIVV